jgi:hypothetical protein
MINTNTDKLACFIHSTTLDLWKDSLLIGILDRLKMSGLLYRLHHLCVINTGQNIDNARLEKEYAPLKIVYYSENTMEFENATIRFLSVFSKMNPEYKLLYMHTKGVSYTPDHVFYSGIQEWNRYMMYSLVDKFEKCLSILKVYDTVGVNYRPTEHGNGQHYSGNYWWANCNYIETLPISYLKDKYHPEFWLLQNDPLFFNIHTIEHMYEQTYPVENYKESVQRGFDENIIFCKVGFPRTGLCNQLYNIANSMILAAVQDGAKVIILDDFIKDIYSLETIPAKDVLNIEGTNKVLEKYNITLICKSDVKMTLDKVEYGLKDVNVVDTTQTIRDCFYRDNCLYIPQWTGFNDVVGIDPCPQMRKQIYVYYSLNGISFMKTFHERKLIFNSPIEINFLDYSAKPCNHKLDESSPWLTRINRDDAKELKPLFDSFLRDLRYQSCFYEKAHDFLKDIDLYSKVNVWHVRNEADAMEHWGKLNNMTSSEYQTLYETKYINCVRKNINKSDVNIVLTSLKENNNIIETLKYEGYQIYVHSNIEHIGRELNGLIDMLIGTSCNQLFIGNFNPHTLQGSTFSYTLFNILREHHLSSLVLNMDDIHEDVHLLF